MNDIKNVLLYSQIFDENNMFDIEHNNEYNFSSEVSRSETNRRLVKTILKYCDDAILDLIDLTIKITDMVV